MAFPSEYDPYIFDKFMTGSRAICIPAPTDTDEDWVVLVTHLWNNPILASLYKDGWKDDGSRPKHPKGYGEQFISYKKDELNLIVTDSFDFFQRFKRATALAKLLNLVEKKDRILLFDEILYGDRP